jgi:hypothetical protein
MVVAALAATALPMRLNAQTGGEPALHIGDSDLAGIVTSASGPEPGVWVIAETHDLPTKFAKIVVTDDHGRYLMPDLPKTNYSSYGYAATG